MKKEKIQGNKKVYRGGSPGKAWHVFHIFLKTTQYEKHYDIKPEKQL